MSAETETQYNPQYGIRRTIFSDEYDFLTKIESVCVQEVVLEDANEGEKTEKGLKNPE